MFSKKLNRFYVGATQEDVEKRIQNHNMHVYGNHRYTSTAEDWELFHFIEAQDYSRAIRIERQIKKMKSKTFIMNLKKYPEMVDKLKEL